MKYIKILFFTLFFLTISSPLVTFANESFPTNAIEKYNEMKEKGHHALIYESNRFGPTTYNVVVDENKNGLYTLIEAGNYIIAGDNVTFSRDDIRVWEYDTTGELTKYGVYSGSVLGKDSNLFNIHSNNAIPLENNTGFFFQEMTTLEKNLPKITEKMKMTLVDGGLLSVGLIILGSLLGVGLVRRLVLLFSR